MSSSEAALAAGDGAAVAALVAQEVCLAVVAALPRFTNEGRPSSSARPGSPLWPVAHFLERPSTIVEQEPQTAIDGAQRLPDSAHALVDDVRDPEAAAHGILPAGLVC